MSKIKIITISIITFLIFAGIGFGAFMVLHPSKNNVKPIEKKVENVSVSSTNQFQKNNFDNSKKSNSVEVSTNPDDFKPKKFTDADGQPIKETDLNTYSQARDESKIYSDDFVNANCESYNLTINSSQNCYINFRKEILDSEVGKISANIVQVGNSENVSEESKLRCVMLSVEQNPNKNTLSCTTDNLRLKYSGNYNLNLTIGEDILTNSLEKNIEVLTVDEFQTKDRKSTRLNSSHRNTSRMPSSA